MIEQAAAMLAEAAAMLRGGGEEEVAEAPSPVEMAADGSASSAYTDSPEYAALLAERDVLKMKLASGKQVVNYVAQLVELGMEPKEASEKMSAFRNNAQRKAYVDATAEHMGGGDPPAWTGEQPAPGREPATPRATCSGRATCSIGTSIPMSRRRVELSSRPPPCPRRTSPLPRAR